MTTTLATAHPFEAVAPQRATAPNPLEYSIRQAAGLVGVTERSLRYWHQVGLLPEANRRAGTLVYSTAHLLRMLRIKRLVAAGLTLDQVADVLATPGGGATTRALRSLDRALADRLAEIKAQRRVIAEILDAGAE